MKMTGKIKSTFLLILLLFSIRYLTNCGYNIIPSVLDDRKLLIESWEKNTSGISKEFYQIAAERVNDREDAKDPLFIGPMIYESFQGTGIRHTRCGLCHLNVEEGTLQGFVETETDRINPFTGEPFGRIESICTSCHRSLHLAHPVGIVPNPDKVILPLEARGFRGEEDRLTCLGCHNHHPINKNYKYLRWPTDGGQNKAKFCAHCHPDKNAPDRIFDLDEFPEKLKVASEAKGEKELFPQGNPYLKKPEYEIERLYDNYQGATYNLDKYNRSYHVKKMLTNEEWSKMRAEDLYVSGKEALEQGDIEKAIRNLQLAKESLDDINQANDVVLFTLGKAYIMNAQYDQAKIILKRALIIKPDHAEANFWMGQIYSRDGQLDSAIYHFLLAAKLRPNSPEIYLNLGKIYLKNGVLDRSREMFEKAIQLDYDLPEAHVGLGQIDLESGQIKQAKHRFERALKSIPYSIEALTGLGECLLHEKDYKSAVAVFTKILSKQETSLAYLGLGKAYFKTKKTANAVEALEKALNLDKKNPLIQYQLGMAYAADNLLGKSYQALSQAVKAEENYTEAWYELGKTCFRLKKFQEGVRSLNKVLEIRPDYAQAYVELGRYYHSIQKLPLAIKAYQKAIKLSPHFSGILNDLEKTLVTQCDNNATYCGRLGDFYLSQNKYLKAVDPFQKATGANSKNAQSHLGLGRALIKLKRYAQARISMEKAEKLIPNSPQVHYYLGMILRGMDKEKEWRKELSQAVILKYLEDHPGKNRDDAGYDLQQNPALLYETAIEINPEDPEAHNNLGTAYMVEGKFGKAIEEYERALRLYPDYSDYLYNIGLAAGSAHNYKKAEKSYRALLKIAPDHFQARYNLGKLYQVQGMLDKAIAEFYKILALRPQIINISLGHLYLKKWEKKAKKEWLIKSQSHFKEALIKDKYNTEARKNLEFIQNILSGKIQALIIQSNNHDRIKRIAKEIKRITNFKELKAIFNQYKNEAQITFCEKESLGKKLWEHLSSLGEGELSPIIFHKDRYFLFYRTIVPPERNL